MTKIYETENLDDLGSIKDELQLDDNELPVASTISTPADWTFVTTKKVIGRTDSGIDIVNLNEIEEWNWGDFKGYSDQLITKITLTTINGQHHSFVIETGFASMAMIYAIQTLTHIKK